MYLIVSLHLLLFLCYDPFFVLVPGLQNNMTDNTLGKGSRKNPLQKNRPKVAYNKRTWQLRFGCVRLL